MSWTPRNRKPKQAGDILDTTLQRLRLDKKAELYHGFPRWREIVGEDLAAIAKPIKLIKRKVLVVRVTDIVWAQELSLQKRELIDKLLAENFCPVLEDIKFITGNPKDNE